jgi:hypothetical protein
MFRAYLGSTPGGTTACIQQLTLIILFWVAVCCAGWIPIQPAQQTATQKRISTNCCIHAVLPPDDGPVNRVKKTQLDAQLILSILCQTLHVSGMSRPIIRRCNRMYTTIDTYYYC